MFTLGNIIHLSEDYVFPLLHAFKWNVAVDSLSVSFCCVETT